ncbi:hypothetical protein MD484_g5963, partial [Candolleomyces efflorescens]
MSSAPIEHLPEDVLCEIFSRCLPSPLRRITLSPKNAPVVLTHVCQRWRRTAIAFPKLWSWLKIVLPTEAQLEGNRHLVPTQALERSKTVPLNIQLTLADSNTTTIAHPAFINQFLFPVSKSLTRLTLARVAVAQLQTLPSGLFPSLERLDALSLHHVAISRWILDVRDIEIILPAERITHFIVGSSIESGDDSDCLFFLSHYLPNFTNLRCLFLNFNYYGDILESLDEVVPQATRMESVRNLSLDFWPEGLSYPTLFNLFDFPNLQKLRLEGDCLDFPAFNWDLPLFLSKVKAMTQLEHLSLFSLVFPDTLLPLLFAETPHLTVLDIRLPNDGMEEKLFPLLTLGPEAEEHLLPKLRVLVIEPGLYGTIASATFVAFVESRVRQGHLEKIIFAPSPTSESLIKSIQPFVLEGLVIVERITQEVEFDWNGWAYRDSDYNDWLEVEAAIQ